MTAILILIGIGVVIIAVIVMVTVPVKHVEAVARDFSWRRMVHIGRHVWVKKKSKRQPKPSADIQNVKVQYPDDPGKLCYLYEQRVWRNMRSVPASGRREEPVRDPRYTLGRDEEVRNRTDSYKAAFLSEDGTRYSAQVRFTQWKALRKGTRYRLGSNAFGRIRTVKPARSPSQRPPERARRDP